MNDNYENENKNFEVTGSLKRSSSILKTGDNENQRTMMYGDETMAFSEMTTKTKTNKIRRVSFSARIQVKTIDESMSDQCNGHGENQKQEKQETGKTSSRTSAEMALTDISNQVTVEQVSVKSNTLKEPVAPNPQLQRLQQIQSLEPGDMSLLSSPANLNRTDIMCHSMELDNNTIYPFLPDESNMVLGNATIGAGCISMNVTNGDSLMIENDSSNSTIGMSSDDPMLLATRTNITATMMMTKRVQMMQQAEQSCVMEAEPSQEVVRLEVPALEQRKLNETISIPEPSFINQSRVDLQEKMENAVERLQLTQPSQQSTSVMEISTTTRTRNITYDMSLLTSMANNNTKTVEKMFTTIDASMEDITVPHNMTITLGQEKSIANEPAATSNKTYDVSVAEITRRSQMGGETYMIDNATKIIETSSMDAPNSTRVISSAPAVVADSTYSVRPNMLSLESSVFSKPIDLSDSIALVSGTSMMEKSKNNAAVETPALAGIQHETILIDNTRVKSLSPNKPNSTVTIQASAPHMIQPEDCLNMSNITSSNLSRLVDNFNSSILMGTHSHMNNILSSTAAPVNPLYSQMNGTVDLANATFDKGNVSVVDLTKSQPAAHSSLLTKYTNDYKALKELVAERLNKMKEYKKKLEESFNKLKEEENIEESLEKIKKLKIANEQAEERVAEKRNELTKLKMKILNDTERVRQFIFQDQMLEKSKSELKNLLIKNQSIEKEYKETSVLYEKLKDKIENNRTKIKAVQEDHNEKEKFKSLCQKLFNESELPFKITSFENDTIKLSFFYDLIHLDIKVSNIINDLSAQQQTNIRDLNQQQRKYLNYPIQQLFFRSSVDKNGVLTDSNSNLKKILGSKVPLYLRYCIDLVLSEIGEGDLMTIKKRSYKYVKDLPMLITNIKLACSCAINLAKDFEHFGTKTIDTNIKCDFDFKNHMLTLELPSVEDACYFRLKLKVLPGAYYQQPIEFSIEPVDDSYNEPNISRLSNLINNQYFENGSFRSYLKKLNLF